MISQAFITVWSTGTSWSIDDWARRTGQTPSAERFEPLTWSLYEMGHHRPARTICSIQDLQRARVRWRGSSSQYDVWLSPTLAEPPPPLGSFEATHDNPMQGIFRSAQFVPFTRSSTQPASPRCPCRSSGTRRTCRSACSSPGDTATRRRFSGSPRSSSRRASVGGPRPAL